MGSSSLPQHLCVFGLGWGDEGKGKIVDMLSAHFDYVVRFNGGANAGHTVRIADQTFAFHLLPTGLLREGVIGVIGPGVVVDPITLIDELDRLRDRGVDAAGRLRISDRAHLVLSYHKIEDILSEKAAKQQDRIGTTARGIGPCYADKMKRSAAIRFCDLLHDDTLLRRARDIATGRKAVLKATYGDDGGLDPDAVVAELETARERLEPFVCDTTTLLSQAMDAGKRVLFEGANGMLLDVDHGTYPFVTSSNTGPQGLPAGAGVSPRCVERFVGTIKAYSTRVGAGPFPSELDNEVGDTIRRRGNEFGTTTGRPRRCGWFDAVATRYATALSGCSDVALMHLDTLSGFERIGICVAYELDGEMIDTFPADARRLQRVAPVFEFVEGWSEDLTSIRRFEDLPDSTRAYIARIETLISVPVSIASVGPDREQTLIHDRLRGVVND